MTLIIPHFNQFSYCLQLIAWWNLHVPGSTVIISDNGSDGKILKQLYNLKYISPDLEIDVRFYQTNQMRVNLLHIINEVDPEYYCISNPDILPCPGTPENFLEVLQHCIDYCGYHRAGFALRVHDIPEHYPHKEAAKNWGEQFFTKETEIKILNKSYTGWETPIDLTFCLYKRENGGVATVINQDNKLWHNSIRLFEAFHLSWYEQANSRLPEIKNYALKCLGDSDGRLRGVNHWNPNRKLDKLHQKP